MTGARKGGCLCGAVRFEIAPFDANFGACHCKMCQRWTGGVFMGLTVPADTLTVTGRENINIYASSDWADRSFCDTCGASLWYRVQDDNTHHIPIGLLDDTTGLHLKSEIFYDLKPDCFDLSPTSTKMNQAETLAIFAPQESDE